MAECEKCGFPDPPDPQDCPGCRMTEALDVIFGTEPCDHPMIEKDPYGNYYCPRCYCRVWVTEII